MLLDVRRSVPLHCDGRFTVPSKVKYIDNAFVLKLGTDGIFPLEHLNLLAVAARALKKRLKTNVSTIPVVVSLPGSTRLTCIDNIQQAIRTDMHYLSGTHESPFPLSLARQAPAK